MRIRQLGATVVALALAAGGLSACTNKVGAAAIVDGQRISDNTVNRYVKQGAVPFSQTDQSSGAATTVVPKVNVLEELVTLDIFDAGLQVNGGTPTAAEKSAAQTSLLSGESLAAVVASVEKQGFTAGFATLALNYDVLLTILEQRLKDDGSGTVVLAALNKLHIPVEVSPRYGSWDASTYSITTGATANVPSFIRLTNLPGPTAAAG